MYLRVIFNFICFFVLLAISASAQISVGGKPASFGKSIPGIIDSRRLPRVDVAAYLAEDMQEAGKDIPYRFGAPIDVSFNMNNSGSWNRLADGSNIWRLEIISEGAYSLNLLYDEFYLPEGGRFFLYNSDQSSILGAFTSANNKSHRKFSTAPTPGDKVILEYYQPASVTEDAVIKISRVVHAYRNIFHRSIIDRVSGFGDAGSCNNNVNCAVGDEWQDQIRAVSMILTSGGFRLCTGSLVNNVRNDGTPYYLTANHCLGGHASWIFMFNYDSPTCSNIDGPTWMTVQGSTLMASYSTSDFGLLLLTEQPPDSYNVYYNGWSAENVPGDSSVGIHHPSGDIKKISFDYDFVTATSWLGTAPGTTHWRVGNWEDGTTEPGSSGSPLYNKQKQVIGQLHGGYASCASITADWYGRVARSWLGGGANSNSMKPWLDPDNTGILAIDGFDPNRVLVITHLPFENTTDTLNDYEIVAIIESDTTLLYDSLLLYYTINNITNIDTLDPTGGLDEFHGFIPAQSPGTVVEYYIFAQNVDGDVDTSDVFTFEVIAYSLSMSPESDTATGAVDDTISYSLIITNEGAIADEYGMSISGNLWTTDLLDETGAFPVSSTGALLTGEQFSFLVRVIVPVSTFGQSDNVTVTAASVLDGGTIATSSLTTISAGQPTYIPFADGFASVSIDPSLWVMEVGIAIDTSGLNEPSAPYSVRFNGDPSGSDTLMSQAIDLSGMDSVILSYYYQRTGGAESPDAGDDLFVEYFNSSGQWVLFQQHLGSGSSMTKFQQASGMLGSDAYHSAFRLRLWNLATPGNYDDWFVDDIRVDAAPVASVTPLSISITLDQNDSAEANIIVSNIGQGLMSWNASAVHLTIKNQLFENLNQWGEVEPARRKYSDGFHDYIDLKGSSDPRSGFPVEKDAGGPDMFGYVWIDSDEPGGPAFNWLDISATGTDIVGDLTDDNFGGPYNIGMDFPYYVDTFNQIYIGSNGIIGFSSDNMQSRFKTTIPDGSTPNNILAWMWDDLNPVDGNNPGAHVYIDTTGDRCVIQFVDYPEYLAGPGDVINMEIILYADGNIKFQYLSVASGFDVSSSTIGIENSDGTDGLEVAYLTPYATDSLAVVFSTPYLWLALDNKSGSIEPGASDTILASFNSGELEYDVYYANIVIESNDPNVLNNPWIVPAQLTVSGAPPFLCGDVDNNGEFQGILELTYLVDFIFRGGPPPENALAADVDGSGGIADILDLTYMVDFIFRGGPAPVCQ